MTRLFWVIVVLGIHAAMERNGRAEDIVPPNAKVTKVAGDCRFTEGPAADGEGNVFFTDSPRNRILVIRPDGKVEVWTDESGSANGMRFDAKGRLIGCCSESGARAVVRFTKERKREILADRYAGNRFNAPNDLCFDRLGRIYFTDPCYGKKPTDGQEKFAIYRIGAKDGEPVVNEVTRVIDDVDTPNGIAISLDNKTLYVADSRSQERAAHADCVRHRRGRRLHSASRVARFQGWARYRRHDARSRWQYLRDGGSRQSDWGLCLRADGQTTRLYPDA